MIAALNRLRRGGIPFAGTTLHLADLRMAAVLVATLTAIILPGTIL